MLGHVVINEIIIQAHPIPPNSAPSRPDQQFSNSPHSLNVHLTTIALPQNSIPHILFQH